VTAGPCHATGAGGHTWEGLNPPYSTIVADPPWPYDGQVGAWDDRGAWLGKSKPMPYSCLTVDDISALSVAELGTPGGHLYLWTTNRYLEASFAVARAWGFDPVTTLVWCKIPKGRGPGGRFSVTTEFLLFCRDRRRAGSLVRQAREAAGIGRAELHRLVRGGAPTGIVYRWEADDCLPTPGDWAALRRALPQLADVSYPAVVPPSIDTVETTWFQWPRGPHSQKPAAALDVVERVSPGPYVELFARAPRLGWDSWGYGFEEVAS
jgi:N6-adenosine-specific RNA methylase IME4